MPPMPQQPVLPEMGYAPPPQEPTVSAPAIPQQFLPPPVQVSSTLVAPSSDASLMPPPPAPPKKAKKKRVTFDPDIPDDEPSTTSVDPSIGLGQQKVRRHISVLSTSFNDLISPFH